MGCFDTVHFKCPACGENISEQSKADGCFLESYTISDAPLKIIADLNARGTGERLKCEACGVLLKLNVKFIAELKVKDD